jgi:hypothetical protein
MKQIIQDLINGRLESAQVAIHEYLLAKTQATARALTPKQRPEAHGKGRREKGSMNEASIPPKELAFCQKVADGLTSDTFKPMAKDVHNALMAGNMEKHTRRGLKVLAALKPLGYDPEDSNKSDLAPMQKALRKIGLRAADYKGILED